MTWTLITEKLYPLFKSSTAQDCIRVDFDLSSNRYIKSLYIIDVGFTFDYSMTILNYPYKYSVFQRVETNDLHLNSRDSGLSKPVVTPASYPRCYRSTRRFCLRTGKYAKCCSKKSEERPADKNSWGDIWDRENEEFLSLDKSQSKHPESPPRSQIPVDADWTSSSTIFTVCRRIDLSMRGYPRPTGTRPTTYVCTCI